MLEYFLGNMLGLMPIGFTFFRSNSQNGRLGDKVNRIAPTYSSLIIYYFELSPLPQDRASATNNSHLQVHESSTGNVVEIRLLVQHYLYFLSGA